MFNFKKDEVKREEIANEDGSAIFVNKYCVKGVYPAIHQVFVTSRYQYGDKLAMTT